MHCIRTILSIILIALAFASCQPSTPMPSTDEFIIWKGNLESAPDNPEAGWTYYNTTEGSTYIFLQDEWRRIASDGLDINWLGEYESAPVNPERNDAYFNSIDGNSYIFDGTEWDYLAKKGEDGTSGILKWYGERTSHISSPKDGDAYHNTIDSKSYIYYSGSWHVLSEDGEDGYGLTWLGTFSSHPSGTHEINSIYYNTTDGISYIWTGTRWDVFNESNSQYITVPVDWQGSLSYAPSNPEIGWTYYNTTTKASYIYDGSVWQQIAKDGSDAVTPEGYLMQWKGTYSSHPSGAQQGWAYYNTRNNTAYIYDGSVWNVLVEGGSTTGSVDSSDVTQKTEFEVLIDGKIYEYSSTLDLGTIVYGENSSIRKKITIRNTGNHDLGFSRRPEDNFYVYAQAYKNILKLDTSGLADVIPAGGEDSFELIFEPDDNNFYCPMLAASLDFYTYSGQIYVCTIRGRSYGPVVAFTFMYNDEFGTQTMQVYAGYATTTTMYSSIVLNDYKVNGSESFTCSLTNLDSNAESEYRTIIRSVSIEGQDSEYFDVDYTGTQLVLDFNPDSSRTYNSQLRISTEYNNRNKDFIIPITIGCIYEPISPVDPDDPQPSDTFFDSTGTAYFDSGEGDGDDSFCMILPKPDGGHYIIGTAWEYITGYSDYDFVVLELDASDKLINTYKADRAPHQTSSSLYYQKGVVLDDGRILLVYNSMIDIFDPATCQFTQKAVSGTTYKFIDDELIWYLNNNAEVKGVSFEGEEKVSISLKGLQVVSSLWHGVINGSESLVVAGYDENRVNEHSNRDAVVQLYQNSGADWSMIKEWVWDNGHYDNEEAKTVVSDGNYIYSVVFGQDYVNGWTSAYYINRFGVSDDEPVTKVVDNSYSLFEHEGSIYYWSGNQLYAMNSECVVRLAATVRADDFTRKQNGFVYSDGYVYYGYSSSNMVNSHSKQDWVIRKAVIE